MAKANRSLGLHTVQMLAPYFAVWIFWDLLSNAWLAILVYHAQIVFWSRRAPSVKRWPDRKRLMLLALPTAFAGPILYFLLPHITQVDLSQWLTQHHLSRMSLAIMIPYFGLIHPMLEQIHWSPLRAQSWIAHPLFAGYHLLVLHSLLTLPWLVLCFCLLTFVSIMWQVMQRRSNSLAAPVASHVLADLGVITAAWFSI